ncbi:hypothetical protein [Granulicella arctica]|uniref:Uncharacterized protein n=1 Tax=Granulicella arctica TaxID=940613 RepID=A0A7Y9TGV0_9BACT|nr:hypothetical protein [Granulicella arctica]NYF79180.1 hypothetical protein [Granulicella arctica]
MTRLSSALLFVTMLAAPCATLAAQATSAQTPAPISRPPAAPLPSVILQPALDNLQQTLAFIHPDRWKTSATVNQETLGNIASIQTDLKTTLPPLLTVADANPSSIAQTLPAYRNIEALYDVLLRVTEVATLAAPTPQSNALKQSLESLERSRRDLGDRLQSVALTENQRLHDLQSQLRTTQSTPTPTPAVCPPPPAPVKKRKPRPKPTPKPTTPATTTPSPQ